MVSVCSCNVHMCLRVHAGVFTHMLVSVCVCWCVFEAEICVFGLAVCVTARPSGHVEHGGVRVNPLTVSVGCITACSNSQQGLSHAGEMQGWSK